MAMALAVAMAMVPQLQTHKQWCHSHRANPRQASATQQWRQSRRASRQSPRSAMEDALVVAAPRIRETLTYTGLIESLRGAYSQFDKFAVPSSTRHDISAGIAPSARPGTSKQKEKGEGEGEGEEKARASSASLLLMPAWGSVPEFPYVLVKSVTVFPENGKKGLPAVAGTYVLSCLETGKVLAVMDGTELILWRTACTSALASDYLSRKDAQTLVMVGAGALAPHLIKAHLAIRPSLTNILIWNRTPSTAQTLAQTLTQTLAHPTLSIRAVTDLESAVRTGDIISCATLASQPVVLGAWLAAGAHLDLVGSFTPLMRECDAAAIQRCRVVVDSWHAVESSGDLAQPIAQGVVGREHVLGTLAELVMGSSAELVQGLRSRGEEVTLFKTVGCSVGDVAAAKVMYESLIGAAAVKA